MNLFDSLIGQVMSVVFDVWELVVSSSQWVWRWGFLSFIHCQQWISGEGSESDLNSGENDFSNGTITSSELVIITILLVNFMTGRISLILF